MGLENVAPDCNGGKRRTGTCGKRHCMEHRVFIMSAQSCKMRPLSAFKRDCSCTKCLSDRGQLTMIAAMSSNQAYAAQSSSLHRVLFAAIVAAVTGLIEIRWSGCGPHLVSQYSQFIVWQIQTQMTTTKSTTTATATSLSQLSVNRSRRTYARCVWCSSATHDFPSCRAGTSVSVILVSLSLSNKLAVAQYAALTSSVA